MAGGFQEKIGQPSIREDMALLPICLLTTAQPASSLKCYTCTAQSSNDRCMTPTACSAADKYCMTIVGALEIGSPGAVRLSKLCMPECTETNTHGISTSCCQSDFCNSNGAAGERLSNVMLLAGIVGPLARLFL
nr:lymphocyte antigen 6E-like isoform X1 [Pogona vitticeps]